LQKNISSHNLILAQNDEPSLEYDGCLPIVLWLNLLFDLSFRLYGLYALVVFAMFCCPKVHVVSTVLYISQMKYDRFIILSRNGGLNQVLKNHYTDQALE
jgi:hypothetical protein